MKSFFQELILSMQGNKLRTALTSFSIAWGIFLLIILLGAGYGVQNGLSKSMNIMGMSNPSLTVELGKTQEAYAGFKKGRQLYLDNKSFPVLKDAFKDKTVDIVPFAQYYPAIKSDKGETSSVSVSTMTFFEQNLNKLKLESGRFFNEKEHENAEKVILISDKEISKLFPQENEVIGKSVHMWGVSFKIIGVIKDENLMRSSFKIPFNTFVNIFPNEFLKITDFRVYPQTNLTIAEISQLSNQIKTYLRKTLKVSPSTDEGAIYIQNPSEDEKTMEDVFKGIRMLLWIIGISSLTIGVVGVSNIMQVTVRERIREIGIRKALGAKPKDILVMILGESLLLSLVSGIVGIIVGIGTLDLISFLFKNNGWGEQIIPGTNFNLTLTIFENPQVNLSTAIGALIVLIVAGIIAGYAPAKQAIKIPTIVAMRDLK